MALDHALAAAAQSDRSQRDCGYHEEQEGGS